MRIKDENKYKSILKASINQFRKEGFAKASISKIAKEADVSPGTIYIYFENKEDLIQKLYVTLRKEMSDIVLGDIQLEGCFESAYKQLWFNYYRYCLNHSREFAYIMQYTHSPYGQSSSSEDDVCYFNKIYSLFKIGKDKGMLKPVSDEILFAYTFYPASQLAKRQLCCSSRLSKEEVDHACEIAWDGVSLRKAQVSCKKLSETLNSRLVNMYKKGEKEVELLGVEFEHFLLDKDSLRSYDYHEAGGQFDIAKKLVKKGWLVTYEENGYIFNLDKNKNSISFEPGGQFEISIRPCEGIEEVDRIYQCVLSEVKSVMLDNQILLGLGYHPRTKIDNLSLLPKERYHYMYKYLHDRGPMARNMMKGTAATQVSIDYSSEEDFKKKYRVANFLAPFIAKLFDASPYFEGDLYAENNLRINIWEHTDRKRSKLPEGAMDRVFSYEDYAAYIEQTQPIIMIFKSQIVHTGRETIEDLSKSYYLSDAELDHGMSMVFPDVRLKHFLELRMADSLPYPFNLAIPALVKGIFYNKDLLDKYYDLSLAYKDHDMEAFNLALKEKNVFDVVKGDVLVTSDDFIDDLITDALSGLKEDGQYLDDYYKFYKQYGNVANYIKEHGSLHDLLVITGGA